MQAFCQTEVVQRNKILPIVLAVVAILVAWWLVGFLFAALRMLFRVAMVLVVAVVVYVAVSSWLNDAAKRRE